MFIFTAFYIQIILLNHWSNKISFFWYIICEAWSPMRGLKGIYASEVIYDFYSFLKLYFSTLTHPNKNIFLLEFFENQFEIQNISQDTPTRVSQRRNFHYKSTQETIKRTKKVSKTIPIDCRSIFCRRSLSVLLNPSCNFRWKPRKTVGGAENTYATFALSGKIWTSERQEIVKSGYTDIFVHWKDLACLDTIFMNANALSFISISIVIQLVFQVI